MDNVEEVNHQYSIESLAYARETSMVQLRSAGLCRRSSLTTRALRQGVGEREALG